MSALRPILQEEQQRLGRLCRKYRAEISKLPKGSISVKARRGRLYAYLAYRDGGRVVFKYIGGAQSKKVAEIREKIRSRKRFETLLKKARANLKETERALA
jgi:hypothetical protein